MKLLLKELTAWFLSDKLRDEIAPLIVVSRISIIQENLTLFICNDFVFVAFCLGIASAILLHYQIETSLALSQFLLGGNG